MAKADRRGVRSAVRARSDCEKDPWRVGGLARDLSATVLHRLIPGAAHHEDLRFSDDSELPAVAAAKAFELGTIRKWVAVPVLVSQMERPSPLISDS